MNIYKVLPDLKRDRQMKLWHKALRAQWSATDLDWKKPQRPRTPSITDELARVLTPVLMGEQSALYSVSGLIPVLGHRSEVESQFYLTTWAVDEARHTELFAKFYERLEREPMSIRRFPAGYLFQSRIISDEPAEWLAGVLASECLALKTMEQFRDLDLDPVLSDISDGILLDESRHLGFNHIYLEERVSTLLADGDDAAAEAFRERLEQRLDYVLEGIPPILQALDGELKHIGIDPEAHFADVQAEARKRLLKSIESGHRVHARRLAGETGAASPTESIGS